MEEFKVDVNSPYYKLGALAMAARLYLRNHLPQDRAVLVRLVNAELPDLTPLDDGVLRPYPVSGQGSTPRNSQSRA